MMRKRRQLAHGLRVPLTPNPVLSPVVQYGGAVTAIHFMTDEDRWGRVTFEQLDSIKVARGEYDPFPLAPLKEIICSWVTTISNSVWLQQRYKYEKKHYGRDYNFTGDVEEMLTEFSHYVFSFHDEFVEAIAAGIWFESDDAMLGDRDFDADHPLEGLGDITPSEKFEKAGIICQVRRNPLPIEELERRAQLCSQTILEVAPELDGRATADWSLTLRNRDGVRKAYLRDYFGNAIATFAEIPDLSAIRPEIDKWLEEVR